VRFDIAGFTLLGYPIAMMKMAPRVFFLIPVLIFTAQLIAQTPTDEQAGKHFQAAQEADRAKDLPTAVTEYRSALKLKPQIAEAWVNLGLDLYVMNRNDEAIVAFQQALKRKPELLGGNLFLGMAYLRNGQYEKAVAPLKKVIALYPKELKAYLNLSFAYQETGNLQESTRVLEAANALFPNNTEVLYNLGKAYTKLMEKTYRQMADVDSDSYRFHQVMGDSYELRKDFPNAQAEYLMALQKCPDPYLPGLHYSLGSSYWMEGRWDPAVEEFKKELAISPEDYMSNWKLGDTYVFLRNYDEARPYLEKALKERPDLGQAYRDMGKLCLLTGKPEEAIDYLNKVEQMAPEESSVHYLLAQAYRKLGKPAEVKSELEMFQKLRRQEADRSAKHPDTSKLGGVESGNERPQEDEGLDDLK
jgi:tetratricopeptide (TPR) repeat protein